MTPDQARHLEADLERRGYKKWTKCLVGSEDYAWFKPFGVHEDADGVREIDYQIAFRIYDHRKRYPHFTPTEKSEIWITVTMLFSIDTNRLDCDYSLQLDVPDIDLCEKMFADMFEVIRKYKL